MSQAIVTSELYYSSLVISLSKRWKIRGAVNLKINNSGDVKNIYKKKRAREETLSQ